MSFDVEQMERDILEVAYTFGDTSSDEATEAIRKKCGSTPEAIGQVTVVLEWLVEERYLFPFIDSRTGRVLPAEARGITPKGYRRLRELQHPIRTWIRANWFGVLVLGVTASISVASMVVNLIVNSD